MTPTVGQIILFNPGAHETTMLSDQPLAALVTYVHSDSLVNLTVFGKNGDQWAKQSIRLLGDDEDFPERGPHARLTSHKGKAKEAKAHRWNPYDAPHPDSDAAQPQAPTPEPWLTRGPRKPPANPADKRLY